MAIRATKELLTPTSVPSFLPAVQLACDSLLENATHCGASLSEQLKSVVGFLQLFKTVLFDFAKNADIFTLSGISLDPRPFLRGQKGPGVQTREN